MPHSFVLVIAFVFALLGYFHDKHFALISAIAIYIHLAFPKLSDRISNAIGYVATRAFRAISILVLSVIYILVLTPLGFLYKKTRRNPMLLNRKNVTSTWQSREHKFSPRDFDKPY